MDIDPQEFGQFKQLLKDIAVDVKETRGDIKDMRIEFKKDIKDISAEFDGRVGNLENWRFMILGAFCLGIFALKYLL